MAINQRLIFWLIKAYIKRWKKTIFICFLLGLSCFFFVRFFLSTIVARFPLIHKEYIGVVGAYQPDSLPPFILQEVSHGLTRIDESGQPQPDLAASWNIQDDGKTYIFHLQQHRFFTDGTPFTAEEVHLSFSDVIVQRPNSSTIIFHLKEPYTPFLITVSRPLFRDGFVGIGGDYAVKDIKQNGPFVASLTMTGIKQQFLVHVYEFYPTQEALRIAFVLGDVSQAIGLTDLEFKKITLSAFPNASVTKETNYRQLVTLFYNTQDKTLNSKQVRDALSYSLPNEFPDGVRASSPLSPKSFAYQADYNRTKDTDHAKLLLKAFGDTVPQLTMDTLPKYLQDARAIQASWKAIGVITTIKVVNTIPDTFQIFLGNFNVPQDPDQYTLWHSDQQDNITNYKSLRIDKLLEDGRKTLDQQERLKIYADFQKYLMDDQPASFLYFPYMYTVVRK